MKRRTSIERRRARRMIPKVLVAAGLLAGMIVGLHLLDVLSEQPFFADDAEEDDEDYGEFTLTIGNREYSYSDDLDTYLLIGTDHSSNSSLEGSDYNGGMADFLLLLAINQTAGTHAFLEINRDTIVDVPIPDENGEEKGRAPEQICIANWYGPTREQGLANTVNTVSELLGGLPINGYYSMDMDDIAEINHALGGVTLTIDEDLVDLDPAFVSGAAVTLTDEQARRYLRARMSVGGGTNEERMHRQRNYLTAANRLVKERFQADPGYVDDLYRELKSDLVTDQQGGQISKIANAMYGTDDLGFLGFEGTSRLGDTLGDGIEHSEFYIDSESIAETLGRILELQEVTDSAE